MFWRDVAQLSIAVPLAGVGLTLPLAEPFPQRVSKLQESSCPVESRAGALAHPSVDRVLQCQTLISVEGTSLDYGLETPETSCTPE